LIAAMRRMANDTGIAVPDTVKMELLEAKNGGGGDFFEKLARYLDELMSEAVLGETLTTNSGERGARSLGEIHNEVRIAIAKAASDLISGTLKESLLTWIVELNFPGASIPDVWRDFSEAEDLDKKVDRDKKLVDMGYRPSNIDYINETYGGDWIETKPADPTQPIDPNAAAGANLADRLAFAERQLLPGERVVTDLSDQLEQAGAPIVDTMIERIRAEFQEARDYDDLVERLARLSTDMGVDDLAGLLEGGMTLGRLEGHDSVSADG
jgi:phage gp29-like protein